MAFSTLKSTLTPTAITNCVSAIEPLNGTKFSSCREQVKISINITDLDYAFRFDKPNPLTATSTVDEKRTYEIWERSNRMSLMIMKNSILIAIQGAISDSKSAKKFLKSVEEQFKGSSKANASTFILKMLTTKYHGLSGEEERLKIEKLDTTYLTTTKGNKKKIFKGNKGSKWEKENSDKASSSNGKESSPKCRIYSGSMVHITNSLQGFLSKRMLQKRERTIRVGDGYERYVEAVGTLKLILKSGFIMYLKDTLYVPSINRNLIYVPKLLLHDYEFMFGYYGLKVYFNSRLVGTGSLDNNLIKLQLDSNFEKSLLSMDVNVISNGKRKHLDEESSSRLWHKRLGHISKDRMQRLIKEGILHHLDFSDFNQCVECIKGKFVKTIKKGSTRSKHLLEIIHTDICGPFINDIGGHKYFITFIDDYSRYTYVYLIKEKSESLDVFKIFKAEVENQLNRKIKIVRSDRGGEYYGKHFDLGQSLRLFTLYCQENEIVNHFTMPYTPQQNGVAERRNRTLMDMVQKRSKGYQFYCPNLTTRIVETRDAEFLKNGKISGSGEKSIDLDEKLMDPPNQELSIPLYMENSTIVTSDEIVDIPIVDAPPHDENPIPPIVQQLLQRYERTRRPVVHDDFITYLNEDDYDLGKVEDPIFYNKAIDSNQSNQWLEAMNDELKSMQINDVWELAELPNGVKPVGCKWVYKTKLDQKGNIERFKAHLVAKGYTQKEGIDYNETFSPVSRKDSLRIVMALVAHYDLELHQMDVKTAFLNGDLHEDVYMTQPEGFIVEGKEHTVCKLKRSIYGLKQASRQWYMKFHEVMSKVQFKKNAVDQCIYLKLSGSKFVILVLYVNDIILASNDLNMLYETKRFLSENFEMKDLGEASYVIGIEIYRDRSRGILGLSQRAYIDKILKKYSMQNCSPTVAPVVKGDKFGAYQCPKNKLEQEEMRLKPYASVVGSLTYAQVCTRPDIAYITGMLGRYQSNPGKEHWKAAKKVLRYLQGTKNSMLTYRKTDNLEVVGYSDSDFAKCKDSSRSTSGYIFMLSGGPISWRSHKQELTTTSTMMAEYVACYHATSHAILLRNLISGLKVVDSISRPIRLYCNNSSSVRFSNSTSSTRAGLYLKTKYLYVREKVEDNSIVIEYISTHDMLADPLTKGLPPKLFLEHVAGIAGLVVRSSNKGFFLEGFSSSRFLRRRILGRRSTKVLVFLGFVGLLTRRRKHQVAAIMFRKQGLFGVLGNLAAIDTAISDEDQALLLLTSTGAKGDGGEGLYVMGRSGQKDMEQGTYSAWSKSQERSSRLSSGADGYDSADVMMAMSVEELLD
ncbi:retrovirus-related pol polyprotein from transposon TNT 1-94 [Tanacetum coccineum]